MSYTDQVSPRKVQEAVNRGFQRLHNFRQARLMFLRNYVGQYYDRTAGEIGGEALNLIFNAIRVLVPNIVLSFPKHTLVTPYLAAKNYGELLGLALDQHDKQINVRDVYRRALSMPSSRSASSRPASPRAKASTPSTTRTTSTPARSTPRRGLRQLRGRSELAKSICSAMQCSWATG
jgi:hypothetical protein